MQNNFRLLEKGISRNKMFLSVICLAIVLFSLPALAKAAQYDWQETGPLTTARNWQSIAVSSDGLHLVAGVGGGRLYTSTDGGTSWNETQPAGDTDQWWDSVASSSDGSHLVAANDYFVYTSSDSGDNWTQTPLVLTDANNQWWSSVASSSDGLHLSGRVCQTR